MANHYVRTVCVKPSFCPSCFQSRLGGQKQYRLESKVGGVSMHKLPAVLLALVMVGPSPSWLYAEDFSGNWWFTQSLPYFSSQISFLLFASVFCP